MSLFKRKKKIQKLSYLQRRQWQIASSGDLYKFRERTLKIITFLGFISVGVLVSSESIQDDHLRNILINIATEGLGIAVTLYIVERIWKKWYEEYQKDKRIVDRYRSRRISKYIVSRRRKL